MTTVLQPTGLFNQDWRNKERPVERPVVRRKRLSNTLGKAARHARRAARVLDRKHAGKCKKRKSSGRTTSRPHPQEPVHKSEQIASEQTVSEQDRAEQDRAEQVEPEVKRVRDEADKQEEEGRGGGGGGKSRCAVGSRSNLPRWVGMLLLYKDFVLEHGHGGVPLTLNVPVYPGLGPWVASQRRGMLNFIKTKKNQKATSKHILSPMQVQMLCDSGFQFKGKAAEIEFNTFFNRFKHFREQYPEQQRVPNDYDTPEFPKLGRWVSNMRANMRNTSGKRRRMLLEAGLDWP